MTARKIHITEIHSPALILSNGGDRIKCRAECTLIVPATSVTTDYDRRSRFTYMCTLQRINYSQEGQRRHKKTVPILRLKCAKFKS